MTLATAIQNTGLTDDAEIHHYFNTPSVPAKGMIPVVLIKQYLTLKGLRVAIQNSNSIPCQTVNLALQDFENFDCSQPLVLAKLEEILTDLVGDTLIPAFTLDDKAYILAMADKLITPAESLGLTVTFENIAQTLRG
jgi:hypothetical protein